VKLFLCALLTLCFAEDSGCNYRAYLGAPLAWVNDYLLIPLPIKIRPLDLILLGVLIASSAKRDKRAANIPQMKFPLYLLLGGTAFFYLYGLFVHGGEARFASWQTYLLICTVLVAFTVASVFRTAADYCTLAKWLMIAATYRAVMCWISYFTWGRANFGWSGAFLTSHDDTIGWVMSIIILLVDAIDRRSTSVTLRNVALVLLFLGAIQFNTRRLAWVSLAMGVFAMYLLFPYGPAKRRVNFVLLFTLPVLLVYVVVGWGSSATIFMPLRSFASVSTQEDGSTLARNAENLGLIATANAWGAVLGSGWGKPYICLTDKYDISKAFELWQYVPHNSILGLLAFTGAAGAAVFWLAMSTASFLNARIARMSTDPKAWKVGIIGVAQLVVCSNQLYGDMGIHSFRVMYVIAMGYAIALRLPRTVGVWDAKERAPALVR
jgi:hypothetical protein